MKKTKYVLALLAAAMILTAGIGQAMAYFTTYVEAEGGFTIWLGDETTITEELIDWEKVLTITNEPGSQPVFVRAKAFAPNTLELEYSGEGWSKGEDGYYYYKSQVAPYVNDEGKEVSGAAAPFKVSIQNIPTDVVKGDSFNVIVIYESTPALYDENGNAYADWNSELVVTKREGATAKPEVIEEDKSENKNPEEGKKVDGEGGGAE